MDDNAKTNVANVVTSIKDCADVGMYMFSKMSPQLGAFVGVGLLVKNYIVVGAPDPTEPILKDLKEVRNSVKRLDDSMVNHFNDVKAFINAQNFYYNIAVKAAVLCEFFSDATEAEDKENFKSSFEYFHETYEKNSPMELGEILLQLLNNEVTNFLKTGMLAHNLMTKEAFEAQKALIDAVFAQLWMLESFASGMFHEENKWRVEQIAHQRTRFEEVTKVWEEEYKTHPYFWPDKVRMFVGKYQDDNPKQTIQELADGIQKELDKILTNDIFYVVAFHSSSHHFLWCKEEQIIRSFDKNGKNVVIFRSATARNHGAEVRQMRKDMEKYMSITHKKVFGANWIEWEEMKGWAEGMANCAAMLLIRANPDNVTIRCTSHGFSDKGPGGSMNGSFRKSNQFSEAERFQMICGFK